MMHLVGLGLVEDARQLVGRAEHLHAVDAHALLERVVVDEADRAQPSCGLRTISRSTSRPPSPAPTISTRLASLRARNPRIGRSAIACADEAHAADERERQQQEERDDAGRHADVDLDAGRRPRDRLGERDEPDDARASGPRRPAATPR